MGSGDIVPVILNLGTRCGWVARFTPRSKSLRYALVRRRGGPHSLYGHGGEEKISSLALPGIKPRSCSP